MKLMAIMAAAAVLAVGGIGFSLAVTQHKAEKMAGKKAISADVKRGRYLAQISGCNDYHTPGYTANAGRMDEELWLTGDRLGWRGPWGTTYPANLRLDVVTLPVAQKGFSRARVGRFPASVRGRAHSSLVTLHLSDPPGKAE